MSEMCAYCQEYFGSAPDLVAHLRSAHQGGDSDASLRTNPEAERPGVVCPRCGRRFLHPRVLATHLLDHSEAGQHSHWPGSVPG